jgi:ABC-type multidrug transport system ATPase subunit
MQEEVSYYEKMTPGSYLAFFSRMAGFTSGSARERAAAAARIAEIAAFMDKPISVLSHGQRQKVSIARALLSDVPVMFLDEPFQGIDIVHRKSLREYLRSYVAKGNSVFFTSHNLIEAEHIVDRFAFIDAGTILTIGTARELRDRYLLPSYGIRASDPVRAQKVLSDNLAATECFIKGDEVVLTLKEAADVPKVAAILGNAGISLLEMKQLGTMEEVFLRMRNGQEGGR